MNNMKKVFYGGGIALIALLIVVIVFLNRANLDYDMSNITFTDKIATYEKGVTHSLEIQGELPEGVKVSYGYNGNFDATGAATVNTHEVTAKFTHNNSRYNPIPSMTATLIVTTEHVITYTYNGNDVDYQTVKYSENITLPKLGELTNAPSNEEFVWVDEEGNIFEANDQYTYPHDKSIELDAVYVYNPSVIEYEFNTRTQSAILKKYYESADNAYYVSNASLLEGTEGEGEGENPDIETPEPEVAPYIYTVSPQVLKDGVIYDVVNIGYDLEEVDNTTHAFLGCKSFDQVVLPQTLTYLGTNVFADCTNLTSVNIPNDVTSIGRNAFANCVNLESIVLPKFVDEVREDGTFELHNGLVKIQNAAFFGCSKLTFVEIPDTTTTIEENAFHKCSSLKFVFIPESVLTIGKDAFTETHSTLKLLLEAGVDKTEWHAEMGDATQVANQTVEDFIQALIDAELIPNPEADKEEEDTEQVA